MEKTLQKLVRDKVVQQLQQQGKTVNYRTLSKQEFSIEIETILQDRVKTLLLSTNSKDRLNEVAEILEILNTIVEFDGFTLTNALELTQDKYAQEGAYTKQLYIETIID